MSNIVRFPGRESRADKLNAVFESYRTAVASRIYVQVTETGRLDRDALRAQAELAETAAFRRLACGPEAFSVMHDLRAFYREALGAAELDLVLADIRASRAYSDHIVSKAADFVRTREIFFAREAQFPPSTIRRPEKNIYFATTFNMVMTRFFVECHKRLLEKTGAAPIFVVENLQDCDRCSLRILQNMHLFLKPFGFVFAFAFKSAAGAIAPDPADGYARRFVAARRGCFRKLLNVALASGNMATFVDTDTLLDDIDFASGYAAMHASMAADPGLSLDDFMNLVYRNRYEEFYVRKALLDAAPSLDRQEAMEVEKLLLLVDSYNYLFDDALAVAEAAVEAGDGFAQCYFLLMKGLVLLKKRNDKQAALATLEQGLAVAEALPRSLEAATEKAFLGNAVNFVRLIETMATKKGDERTDAIEAILVDEHRILHEICEAFISAREADLADQRRQMNVLFIITTVVENISKLNGLIGAYEDTIELYRSYEHILDTVGERMRGEAYKRSFTISYSHALFHNRIMVAKCFANLKQLDQAYEITKDVVARGDEYDVTGDYRGFALNAHAVNAARLGKTEEVVDALVDMARIYVDYNEPYLIKSAINGLRDFIAENDRKSFDYLKSIGIIEDSFRRHEESTFLVSSPVDLENPLIGGMEQFVFGRRSEGELRSYLDHPNRNLNAAFKSYGLWRQIYAKQAT
ncbi:hypothetical protein [Salinarimonas sp.]|uniref:hypothetical protein n=1 Tax=Salinarimonas sp. TaxID=2766526 RepID=UPI0032D8EF98